MTFKEQEIFLISVMNNRNSVSYVQKQMNIIFQTMKHFAKAYIDDVVIRFKSFNEHLMHFQTIFEMFSKCNIFIKSIKVFLKYLDVTLFDQKVNALNLSITKDRFKVISRTKFSITFKDLKHYFKLKNT